MLVLVLYILLDFGTRVALHDSHFKMGLNYLIWRSSAPFISVLSDTSRFSWSPF